MNPTTVSHAIVQEITINASAERIFEALTEPHERTKWWGSEGRFQVQQFESDLRPGGKWTMHGTGIGGKPFVVRGEYREVERPGLLVFTPSLSPAGVHDEPVKLATSRFRWQPPLQNSSGSLIAPHA